MKFIIVLAFCCSAAFAANVPQIRMLNPEKIQELQRFSHLVPKVHSLIKQGPHRVTQLLANPGFREVLEKTLDIMSLVYDRMDIIALELHPLLRDNKLYDVLLAELPNIARRAGEDVVWSAKAWSDLWASLGAQWGVTYPDESRLEDFLDTVIIGGPIVSVSTYFGTLNFLREQNSEVAARFEGMFTELFTDLYNAGVEWLELVDQAIICEDKGGCVEYP